MKRHLSAGIMVLFIFFIFMQDLSADIAAQKRMESEFRYQTGFEGLITWWDDDTMKELDGTFTHMAVNMYNNFNMRNYNDYTPSGQFRNYINEEVFLNIHTKDYDPRLSFHTDYDHHINSVAKDVFQSVIRYTGLKNKDYSFFVNQGFDTFTYRQKINDMYIEDYGYVKIEAFGEEFKIYVKTLPHISAADQASLTRFEAYEIFMKNADPYDVQSEWKANSSLLYIPDPPSKAYADEKPADLLLVWRLEGRSHLYYFDAVTGKLVFRRNCL